MSITIGHDGEFFLVKDGVIVPSQGIMPGTKYQPAQLNTCMWHRDNALGEFGTAPASSEGEFVDGILAALGEIDSKLSEQGVSFLFKPHHVFNPEVFNWEARMFGCEPDFECWGLEEPSAPDSEEVGGLRSGGGHVHAGFDAKSDDDVRHAVFAAEIMVGLYTVIHDDDVKRRTMYGRAGRYRRKPYGLEYRVPSNFWYNSEDHMRQMYRRMYAAVEQREDIVAQLGSMDAARNIADAINNSDAVAAQQLMNYYHVEERIA